jgi:hypothetical protein
MKQEGMWHFSRVRFWRVAAKASNWATAAVEPKTVEVTTK